MAVCASGKALRISAFIVLVLVFSVGDCTSPTNPDLKGGVLATFANDPHNEQWSILITNKETIKELYAYQNHESAAYIPNGLVVKGAVSYNKPWSWHIDSEKVEMAETTVEINDGWPGWVESELDGWAGRYFGPWDCRLVSVKDYR
jgi:hypothetical protein